MIILLNPSFKTISLPNIDSPGHLTLNRVYIQRDEGLKLALANYLLQRIEIVAENGHSRKRSVYKIIHRILLGPFGAYAGM